MAKWNWQDELEALKKENASLRDERDYWKDLWEKAATRVLQIDPEVSSKSTTVVDRLRKLEGVMDEPKKKPNPWTDV